MIDVQVVNDQISLENAHLRKVEKYRPLHDQLNGLRPGGVLFTSFNCNWRGAVSKSSFKDLYNFHLLSKSDFKVLSSRTLIGGMACFRDFQNMTHTKRAVKSGIG